MIDKSKYKQNEYRIIPTITKGNHSKEISIDDSEKARNIESQLENKSSLPTQEVSFQNNTPDDLPFQNKVSTGDGTEDKKIATSNNFSQTCQTK
jgi:hypothetical protein